MIRLKIDWGKEHVFPITELVKRPDFPIKRDRNTISGWIRDGVGTTRGSRVAFPAFLVGSVYHSSVAAAREFVVFLAKRSDEGGRRLAKPVKSRQKPDTSPQNDGRLRRVN